MSRIKWLFSFISKVFWYDCDRYLMDRRGHQIRVGDKVLVDNSPKPMLVGTVIRLNVPDSMPFYVMLEDMGTPVWCANKNIEYVDALTPEELLTHEYEEVRDIGLSH